ncbi:KpsF/GutQ family sugar-phosphate isomerase [Novosphingobium beihaiensis]|uniref:KpsF/GutQ family sugar-phosphate isomerase n=1 Tax=Novosphingobium beihaiensis TaxID=2930389 RepID=A0ABT0BTG0_9SPHN|nr:KpsF/GutQ family sugar-phosphate isomerase [Novosphingobium beihaiensis]MCJ2188346.1 KpsF/GutQ family sugar-phosphate isomerase [Novosphingobium beihaiensis]
MIDDDMNSVLSQARHSASALKTLKIELDALNALRTALETTGLREEVDRAIQALAATPGRVIVTGMGKSGHIARKIAATMRSTGTSALYLHPGEASHGDLGVITKQDVVLAITWSGETAELGDILHYCNRYGVTLIVATSHPDSTAGRAADICLAMPPVREACPNALAPTSSTTLQLVLGDALAVALIEARGFSSSDFYVFHPGGKLGSQLVTVGEIMGVGEAIPRVGRDASLTSATLEMSHKRYGCTAVVDEDERLVGAFTDGDLRRCIAVHDLNDNIGLHMSPNPLTVLPETLASEALHILNENAISVLFVEQDGKLAGIIHMHDIVRAGVA